MGAQASSDGLTRTKGLYIRTGVGVLGPYDADALRTMVKNGVLPESGAVSPDGKSWRRADQIKGLFASGIKESKREKIQAGTPGKNISSSSEMKRLLNHVCENKIYKVFQPTAVYSAGAVLTAAGLAIAYFCSGLDELLSVKRALLFTALSVPAVILFCGVAASICNKLIGSALNISNSEKKFLALHLPKHVFDRLEWGRYLKNWFYGSNWLIGSCEESPNCYVHLFKTGAPLLTIEEDVNLWKRLSASLPYSLRRLCIPGETIRQVQITKTLPKWSMSLSEVTDGYALGGILDENYTEWAKNFLTRARKRLSLPEDKAVDFFLTFFDINTEDNVLAVCVFPRDETTKSGELDETPSGTIAA
ncbi:MAG: hypothetical protein ACYTFY_10720 [Planctomycetota bacterium]|jgi:hypothetical protein